MSDYVLSMKPRQSSQPCGETEKKQTHARRAPCRITRHDGGDRRRGHSKRFRKEAHSDLDEMSTEPCAFL